MSQWTWTWQRLVLGNVPNSILELKTPLAALLTTFIIPSVSNILILLVCTIIHVILHVLFGWSSKTEHICKFNKPSTQDSFSITKFIYNTVKTYLLIAFWVNYHEFGEIP